MKIKSKALSKVLIERDKVNQDIKDNNDALVALDSKRQKLAHKQQRLKDKGSKILDKEFKALGGLEEFEYFTTYNLLKGDEVEVTTANIFDDMFKDPEAIKEKLRDDKKNKTGVWTDELMYIGHNKK